METATWIAAIGTAVYALAFILTVPVLLRQLSLQRRTSQAAVVKDFYDRVWETADDRRIVYESEAEFQSVSTLEDALAFGSAHPVPYRAAIRALNTYQYLGFLVSSGLLSGSERDAVLLEAYAAFERFDAIVARFLELEREARGQPYYKRYLEPLRKELARVGRLALPPN